MASFNKVMLLGNLTRDPQVKFLPNQTQVAEFGIATSRKWKSGQGEDREETTFVECAAFGRQAEVIGQYCQKGKPIFIEGRLKLDQWEDKNGGGKRSKMSVVVENFQLLGGRDQGGGGVGDGAKYDDDYPQAPPRRAAPSKPSKGSRPPAGLPTEPPPAETNTPSTLPLDPTFAPFGDEPVFKDDDIPF